MSKRDTDTNDQTRSETAGAPPWRRVGLLAGLLVGVLTVLYLVDVLAAGDGVARRVSVAGVEIGDLDRATAEQRLRAQLGPRLTRPISLLAGDAAVNLDPAGAGLALDWSATVDRATDQPLNPWTRLLSLFASREIGAVTDADQSALTRALEGLRPSTDRAAVEGDIRYDGVRPVVTEPRPGQTLSVAQSRQAVLDGWAFGAPIPVPVTAAPTTTTSDGVRAALDRVAKPAVAAPVAVEGDGAQAMVEPERIALAVSFAPDGQGGLRPAVADDVVIGALRPQLARTEQPARDATIGIVGAQPTVVPSQAGRTIDYPATLAPMLEVLQRPAGRVLDAAYVRRPAELTTEEAGALGINEVVGEFTTEDFASDSGRNIRRAAEEVNGAIVLPGQTFSLNGHTGPRDEPSGYIAAGIIEEGKPGRGLGGGVSQFATTLYNASYFAGMVDIEHKEHSYYISRYPVAREATVFEGQIDLRFRNDGPSAVLIETFWTPSSITVKLWGTRRYEVISETGPRTGYTSPATRSVPDGEECSPSRGASGFSATDTRILRDLRTGETRREVRTVTYNPQPRIVCS